MKIKQVKKIQDLSKVGANTFVYCKELNKGFVKRDVASIDATTFEGIVDAIELMDYDTLVEMKLDSVIFDGGAIDVSTKITKEIQTVIMAMPENSKIENITKVIETMAKNRPYFIDNNLNDIIASKTKPFALLDLIQNSNNPKPVFTGTVSESTEDVLIVIKNSNGDTIQSIKPSFITDVEGNVVVVDGMKKFKYMTSNSLVDDIYSVDLIATNSAGNETVINGSPFEIDTKAEKPVVILNPIANDDIISSEELNQDTQTISGVVTGADVKNNDEILIVVNSVEYITTVVDGAFSIDVPTQGLIDNNTIGIAISSIDSVGNIATTEMVHNVSVITERVETFLGSKKKNSYYGMATAIDKKIVVSAGASNSVYIYDLDGTNEIKITKNNYFGFRVATKNDKIIVTSLNSSTVYLYDLDGTNEIALTPPDDLKVKKFGILISIDKKIVVGSLDQGAFVYDLEGNYETHIVSSDKKDDDNFGYAVSTSNNKIIVGAWNSNNKGAIYTYDLDGSNEKKITASDAASKDYFGYYLVSNDNKIIVGAHGVGSRGAFYIYDLDGLNEKKVIASEGKTGDRFGYRLAVDNEKIIAGVYNHDSSAGSDAGQVFVYDIDGSNEQIIEASDGAKDDRFGMGVAVGSKIIIGASGNNGKAYIYDK